MRRRKLLSISGLLCLSLSIASLLKADSSAGIFTYQNGIFTTINNSSDDTPLGIDNSGDLLLASGGNVSNPFLLSSGTSIPISVPGATTEAYSISGDGTVLGRYIINSSIYFTDLGGSIVSLPNAPGFLVGINDEGQAIGVSFDGQSNFVYNINTGTTTPISFPGATSTNLLSINDEGEILGSAGNVFFIYNAGTFTTITLPAGCKPTDMNDNGQIVGNCVDGSLLIGFLDNSGNLTYIDYPGNGGLNDMILTGINDSGEIVGSFANAPEPSPLVLLTTGLVCLMGLWLWRRTLVQRNVTVAR